MINGVKIYLLMFCASCLAFMHCSANPTEPAGVTVLLYQDGPLNSDCSNGTLSTASTYTYTGVFQLDCSYLGDDASGNSAGKSIRMNWAAGASGDVGVILRMFTTYESGINANSYIQFSFKGSSSEPIYLLAFSTNSGGAGARISDQLFATDRWKTARYDLSALRASGIISSPANFEPKSISQIHFVVKTAGSSRLDGNIGFDNIFISDQP